MDPLKKIIVLAVMLFTLAGAGCAKEFPDTNGAAYKLYASKCSVCHPLKHPKVLPATAWEATVPRMEIKVKNSGVREPLTEEETEIILGYLKSNSRERQF